MSLAIKSCFAPFRALRSHCGGPCRRTEPPLDEAANKALESVLLTVVNASAAGVTPSSRAQKLHDRLDAGQLEEASRPLSRRKLGCSLERLGSEYEATRSTLQATGRSWLKDWLMGVESFDADELARLYARIEAATAVIHSVDAARAEISMPRARPVSW